MQLTCPCLTDGGEGQITILSILSITRGYPGRLRAVPIATGEAGAGGPRESELYKRG